MTPPRISCPVPPEPVVSLAETLVRMAAAGALVAIYATAAAQAWLLGAMAVRKWGWG